MINHNKPKILLIDAWNIMIGMNSVSNIMDSNTMPIGMYLSTVNQIKILVDKFKPSKVIFAMDGPNAGHRRRAMYAGYKAGRRVKAKKSSIYIQEADDEYQKYTSQGSFTFQLEHIYNFLKHLPVTTVIVPYCEGDDLIAYLTLKNKDDYECIIVSGDKDYCQLIQPGVTVYDWRKKIWFDEEQFLEMYKILPSNYIFMKILLGDSSDEIKGVKGIGKKGFTVFHEHLSDKKRIFESVKDFVSYTKEMSMDNIPTRTQNAIKNMWTDESMENLLLLWKLMKLDENCLKLHHVNMLREQIEQQQNKKLSFISLSILMAKHEFNRLYKHRMNFNVSDWMKPFYSLNSNIKLNV